MIGGVLDEQLVLVAGEDDADGRVVALGGFLGGEVAEIHVHLADVVMFDVVDFQIDQDEAAEDAVVEDEIDPVVGVVEGDAVLPADEGEALAEFQEEGLEVIAEESFEISLGDAVRLGNFQELEDVGIAEQFRRLGYDQPFACQGENSFPVFPCGEAEEKGSALLPLQLLHAPFFSNRLLLVKASFQGVMNREQLDVVGPTQLSRQRLDFWESQIKSLHHHDIAATESFAVPDGEVFRQFRHQSLAIFRTDVAALLELDDVMADLPVGLGDVGIDGLMCPNLAGGVNGGDASQKLLVSGIGWEIVAGVGHGVTKV